MTSDTVYKKRMRNYNWRKLKHLWDRINNESRPIRYWDVGKAFEYLIIKAFELDGAEVEWPFNTKNIHGIKEQIDGVVYLNGISCLIECKDKTNSINVEPIAKLRNQLLRRPSSTVGSIFITSEYTDSAMILAALLSPQTILLWHKNEIDVVMEKEMICDYLVKKYRRCIENGVADYNIEGDV